MRVLLVEDSERLQRSVAEGLRNAGYAVDVTGSGTEGLRYANAHAYDAIVLDLMLPGMSGLDLLKSLRAGGKETHILILSARDTVEDRVLGLRSGADDYLVKPFAFDELLARVQSLTRRAAGRKNPVLKVGRLEIDTGARRVMREGTVLELTAREYALLEYLALRAGVVVSRREIEEHIYDAQVEPMSNVVDAAVYALRKKIDWPGEESVIETRRGMGYVVPERAG